MAHCKVKKTRMNNAAVYLLDDARSLGNERMLAYVMTSALPLFLLAIS